MGEGETWEGSVNSPSLQGHSSHSSLSSIQPHHCNSTTTLFLLCRNSMTNPLWFWCTPPSGSVTDAFYHAKGLILEREHRRLLRSSMTYNHKSKEGGPWFTSMTFLITLYLRYHRKNLHLPFYPQVPSSPTVNATYLHSCPLMSHPLLIAGSFLLRKMIFQFGR